MAHDHLRYAQIILRPEVEVTETPLDYDDPDSPSLARVLDTFTIHDPIVYSRLAIAPALLTALQRSPASLVAYSSVESESMARDFLEHLPGLLAPAILRAATYPIR